MERAPNACSTENALALNSAPVNSSRSQFGRGQQAARMRDGRAHPDDVVHRVDVTVAHVHPDGADGEAVVLPRTVDDHGLMGTGRGR